MEALGHFGHEGHWGLAQRNLRPPCAGCSDCQAHGLDNSQKQKADNQQNRNDYRRSGSSCSAVAAPPAPPPPPSLLLLLLGWQWCVFSVHLKSRCLVGLFGLPSEVLSRNSWIRRELASSDARLLLTPSPEIESKAGRNPQRLNP